MSGQERDPPYGVRPCAEFEAVAKTSTLQHFFKAIFSMGVVHCPVVEKIENL